MGVTGDNGNGRMARSGSGGSSPLREKSFRFAVRIVNLAKLMCERDREYVLSKQIVRSGTAIGALVREARQAESREDFVHKLAIALKEAEETEYWLEIFLATEYLKPHEFDSLHADLKELLRLLTAAIKTARSRLKKD